MENTRKYYTIVDHPELLRDSHSKGLILTDKSVLLRENARYKKKQQFDNLRADVDNLNVKMDNIQALLEQLVKKEKL